MIKINYKKIFAFVTTFCFLVLLPILLIHANPPGVPGPTIQNPLGSDRTDIKVILGRIMQLVATIGSIVVVFFVIFSGFKFVTAKGNEKEVSEAKNMFFATIVGGAILLGADIIANVVVNTVNTTVGK